MLPKPPEPQPIPQATCPRCGARFACRPRGDCWCMAERVRLPLTAEATACLCQDCLRATAAPAR